MPGRSPIRCGPPLYHEINNFYTATVYEKGAEVVRMLKTLLGPQALSRKGMDLYFTRHDGHAATVEQFVQCFADVSGRDLDAVHALVFASGHARDHGQRQPRRATTKTYRLDVSQRVPPTPGQPVKEPMVIPLVFGLVGRDGRDLPLKLIRRTRDRERRAGAGEAGGDVRFHRNRGAAGAFAQSRIFGADQGFR